MVDWSSFAVKHFCLFLGGGVMHAGSSAAGREGYIQRVSLACLPTEVDSLGVVLGASVGDGMCVLRRGSVRSITWDSECVPRQCKRSGVDGGLLVRSIGGWAGGCFTELQSCVEYYRLVREADQVYNLPRAVPIMFLISLSGNCVCHYPVVGGVDQRVRQGI